MFLGSRCWTSGLDNLRGGELSFKIRSLTNLNPLLNDRFRMQNEEGEEEINLTMFF